MHRKDSRTNRFVAYRPVCVGLSRNHLAAGELRRESHSRHPHKTGLVVRLERRLDPPPKCCGAGAGFVQERRPLSAANLQCEIQVSIFPLRREFS